MTASGGGVTIDGEKVTSQRAVAQEMKRLWRLVRGGSYDARRGVINWATWGWPRERAVAIFFADSTLGRQIDDATIVWHVFGRIPDHSAEGGDVDDELLEEMRDDVVRVLNHLVAATDDQGDSLLLGFLPESVTIQEAYSVDEGVQGIVVLFDVGV